MTEVLRLLVFCWLTSVALLAVRSLLLGNRQTVLVVMIGHWAFNATPVLWDLLFGMPTYARYPNFARSALDPTANLIHLLFIAVIPLLLAIAGLPWRRSARDATVDSLPDSTLPTSDPGVPVLALYGLLILPLPVVLFAPLPSLYLQYGFVADDALALPENVVFFHTFVSMAAILSITAAATLLTSRTQLLKQWLATFPWVLIALFLMGKRAIIALYFILLSQRLWDLGILKGARIPIYFIGLATLLSVTLFTYQAVVRNITPATTPSADSYENLRMDYGRDHTIRTALFAEIHAEKITSYRGQASLFNLTAFIPRTWWPQKPYPYSVYLTSYALDIPPTLLGWGFTTSIFDEAIVECGWLGLLVGPLFLGLLCRLADGNRAILFRSLGYIICSLFLAVQLSAFHILFVLWLAGSVWSQHRERFSLRSSRMPQEML